MALIKYVFDLHVAIILCRSRAMWNIFFQTIANIEATRLLLIPWISSVWHKNTGSLNTSLVNTAFQEQRRLHSLGFVTWYGQVCELAKSYGIDLNHTNRSKTQIRHVIRSSFVKIWQESVADINKKQFYGLKTTLASNCTWSMWEILDTGQQY